MCKANLLRKIVEHAILSRHFAICIEIIDSSVKKKLILSNALDASVINIAHLRNNKMSDASSIQPSYKCVRYAGVHGTNPVHAFVYGMLVCAEAT
jgi:hypothetical protein